MIALITGVCGFCGRALARRLACESGVSVVGVDRLESCDRSVCLDEYRRADIGDRSEVRQIIQRIRPDCIFHLAGLGQGDASELYRVNFLGSLFFLDAVRELAPNTRLLLVGSSAEYGRPSSERAPLREEDTCVPETVYGASKYAQTLAGLEYARRYGTRVVVARPFNIVGPGMPSTLVLGAVIERIKRNLAQGSVNPVCVGNLRTERDFVAVDDVVDAYWRLLQLDLWGHVFNLCSGQPTSIRFLVETLISCCSQPVQIRVDSALVRPNDVAVVYGSWEKARRAFGYEPRTALTTAIGMAWRHAIEDPTSCA